MDDKTLQETLALLAPLEGIDDLVNVMEAAVASHYSEEAVPDVVKANKAREEDEAANDDLIDEMLWDYQEILIQEARKMRARIEGLDGRVERMYTVAEIAIVRAPWGKLTEEQMASFTRLAMSYAKILGYKTEVAAFGRRRFFPISDEAEDIERIATKVFVEDFLPEESSWNTTYARSSRSGARAAVDESEELVPGLGRALAPSLGSMSTLSGDRNIAVKKIGDCTVIVVPNSSRVDLNITGVRARKSPEGAPGDPLWKAGISLGVMSIFQGISSYRGPPSPYNTGGVRYYPIPVEKEPPELDLNSRSVQEARKTFMALKEKVREAAEQQAEMQRALEELRLRLVKEGLEKPWHEPWVFWTDVEVAEAAGVRTDWVLRKALQHVRPWRSPRRRRRYERRAHEWPD